MSQTARDIELERWFNDQETPPPPAWPTLDDEAWYGLAGDVVETIEPHTEADPAALLMDFLVSFGSAVGATPHAIADGSPHPARLNVVIVGQTSKARKGTSRANIRALMDLADPGWSEARVMGGLASGEGLIAAVADPDEEGQGGSTDKRLLVVEPEFSRVLGVAGREGSTLSAVIRDAWDNGRLRVMTRREPLVASGAHISILGHCTVEEIRRRLTGTEAANGFANRHLYVCAKRSKLLPHGGNLDEEERRVLAARVAKALSSVRSVGRLRRTAEAEELWSDLYAKMAEDDPGGLVGAITARAEAQTLRLSVVFALLDGCRHIDVAHLNAAYAVWLYCRQSAAYIFGDSLGDEVADRLLAALHTAGLDGLDGTEQSRVFSGHVSAQRLDVARGLLESSGLAVTRKVETGGRPRLVTYAVAKEAGEAKKAASGGLSSLDSLSPQRNGRRS